MKISHNTKEINRQILHLTWPSVVSNISVPLLGLSDTFISGHLGSATYLAAIAVGTTMVNSLYWLLGFLRMGTTGLTANAFGARDEESQAMVYSRALLLALAIGMLLILLMPLTAPLMLMLLSPAADVAMAAREYFDISMLGAPALLATMVCSGRLIGRQNTLYPMIIAISVNVLNILLSFTLVFVLDMGFKGVAYGTLTANWLGFILAMMLVKIQSHDISYFISPFKAIKRGGWGRFFNVNGNLFIRSACLMAVSFAMTAFGGRIGTTTLAVNALMMQLFLFYSYFMDGFAFSGEALCGRFYGAGDGRGFHTTVRLLVAWGCAMATVFATAYGTALTPIAEALTDVSEVVSGIETLRWVAILIPIVPMAAFIFDGIFVGLTKTSAMMWATAIGAIFFFGIAILPKYLGIPIQDPNIIIWTAFLSYLVARGATLIFFYYNKYFTIKITKMIQ